MALVAVTLALAGCIAPPSEGEERHSPPPPSDPEEGQSGMGQGSVSNQPGAFQYGGQVVDANGEESHTWTNVGPRARVQWGGQVAYGAFTLVLVDADGKEMYNTTFRGTSQGGASETTGLSLPGNWGVTFSFEDFTGQMGLQVTTG